MDKTVLFQRRMTGEIIGEGCVLLEESSPLDRNNHRPFDQIQSGIH